MIDNQTLYCVYPQYVIHNQAAYPFQLRQTNDTVQFNIPKQSRSIFCFQQPLLNQALQICRKEPNWVYSGLFTVNPGDRWVVKTSHRETHELLVSVEKSIDV